ncbi:hypothetical protein [Sphingomonas bacterium]|uniref:hypothetical protein n=1 Tax=Sphingomonas bacterium TaxID=1895847 RepID=UPI001576CD35|nr:hypothetical protein [Sphingomonas bacterium]
MMTFTATQFAILALVLVAGWFLGLASHPGGRKWRDRYAAERDAHATSRKDAEARIAAEKSRQIELERENARFRDAAPVPAQTMAPRTAAPVARPVARPAYPAGERRGWFDFAPRT